MATNGNFGHQEQHLAGDNYAVSSSDSSNTAATSTNNLPKDEVGWYFVEQYYTTLSKSPEKLHLFYGKRSQYVNGREAEVTNVSVGRQAIQDRIKALDIQDCKVRISNVDSQGSGENIVIQVIGETSNKAAEPKKFVQTFILAQQPSGYFVLNDIFRFIEEEVDEEQDEAAEEEPLATEGSTAEAEPEVEGEATEAAPTQEDAAEKEAADVDLDADVVDKKLEEVEATTDDGPAEAKETAAPASEAPATTQTEASSATLPDPEKAAREIAEEDVKKIELPHDPSPTPVPTRDSPETPTPAEPEKPKEPSKPLTWASRLAASTSAQRPAVPAVPAVPKPATPITQTRPTAAAAAPAAPTNPAAPQQNSAQPADNNSATKESSEWQTAETKRQNRPQSISAPPTEKEGTMAYIKYVTDKIHTNDLRAVLSKYGELAYFDINRQKNCAFVEFATQAGYNAAVGANPHTVNGEQITVEQRRPKANAYGGSNYTPTRGGTNNRGGRGGSGANGGFESSRGGSQGGPRGNFTGQARGGGRGGAPRGRGSSSGAV